MVQHVIRQSVATADFDVSPNMEGEQAQCGTKVWLPLPGTHSEQFSVYVFCERSDPDLVRSRLGPGAWFRDRCLVLDISVETPMTVMPS